MAQDSMIELVGRERKKSIRRFLAKSDRLLQTSDFGQGVLRESSGLFSQPPVETDRPS